MDNCGFDLTPSIELYRLAKNTENKNINIIEIAPLQYHRIDKMEEILFAIIEIEIKKTIMKKSWPTKELSILAEEFFVLCECIEPMLINSNMIIT